MSNIIGADAAKLAGLQIDTLQKVRSGQVTLAQWERFNNLSPTDREARFGDQWKPTPTAEQPKPPALVLLKTTEVGAVEGKKTGKCLTGKHWAYRDGDIDSWLPPTQPAQSEGVVSVYQLQEVMNFREMAARAAQMPADTSLEKLAAALKERGHVLTLSDLELMVERQESGEDVGLRTDGYANFAFVEDANGSVSVLRVYRYDDRWHADVRRLGDGGGWGAGHRLRLRNSAAPTL